jgi:hypothetical protein
MPARPPNESHSLIHSSKNLALRVSQCYGCSHADVLLKWGTAVLCPWDCLLENYCGFDPAQLPPGVTASTNFWITAAGISRSCVLGFWIG